MVARASPSNAASRSTTTSRSTHRARSRRTTRATRAMAVVARREYQLTQKGDLGNLKLIRDATAWSREACAANAVRVRVKAIGLNFADVFTCLGLYNAAPEGVFVPGLECCGVVVEAGADARGVEVGDRVMCVTRFGAFADHVEVPATQVQALPETWSFEEGAGFLVQGLTSYYGLKALGDVGKGKTVLVHSAAGGCGLMSLGICERVGAKAVAVIGNEGKIATLRERFPSFLKEDAIIVRHRNRFGEQVREACDAIGADEGVDIVFDATLGDFFQGGWDNLARGGRYVVYGAADLTPSGDSIGVWGWIKLAWKYLRRKKVDPLNLPGENKGILGFNLIWQFDKAAELMRLLDELNALKLPAPKVGATFEFEDLPNALRLFQTGQTTGKVVVRV